MNRGIEERIKVPFFSFELLSSKSSSSLMHHDLPIKNHLIIDDYCSLCPEVYLLTLSTSNIVIEALKQTFFKNRISEELFQTIDHNTTRANSEKSFPETCALGTSNVMSVAPDIQSQMDLLNQW